MKAKTSKTERMSIQLTPPAKRLLVALAVKTGVSQADVIEMAVREKAQREGVSA